MSFMILIILCYKHMSITVLTYFFCTTSREPYTTIRKKTTSLEIVFRLLPGDNLLYQELRSRYSWPRRSCSSVIPHSKVVKKAKGVSCINIFRQSYRQGLVQTYPRKEYRETVSDAALTKY